MRRRLDRSQLIVYGYRAAAWLVRHLPAVSIPWVTWLARRLARRSMAGRRLLLERVLTRTSPDLVGDSAAMRGGVDAMIDSYVDYWIESFRLRDMSTARLDAQMNWRGLEYLEAGLAQGRGVIIALPHYGSWDFGGAWLASAGYAPVVAVEALQPESLLRWFVALRQSVGMTVVPNSRTAAAQLAEHLRDNRMVCLVSDRDLGGKGPTVTFFGEETTMPAGPAVFALRHGAPILPTIISVDESGMHLGEITAPIEVVSTGDLRADVQATMQLLAHRFETLIGANPTQWHLFQPNWPSDREPTPADS